VSGRLVERDAIHLIPPDVRTLRELRELVGLDQLQAEHVDHELFVLAFKTIPNNPFAIVLRLRKDIAHIQGRWPMEIDYDTRVITVYRAGQMPIVDGRVG
jgi:hypothetical protein